MLHMLLEILGRHDCKGTSTDPPRGKESGQICHGRRESGQICHGRKTTWGTVNHSLFRKDRDIYYRRFIFKLPQEVSSSASTDSEFWPGLEAFPVRGYGVIPAFLIFTTRVDPNKRNKHPLKDWIPNCVNRKYRVSKPEKV